MRARGFTLIELVITLAIVGLMATAAMPLAQLVAKREKESELRSALRDIRTAIDAYKLASDSGHIQKELDTSGYPPDLKSLYSGVEPAEETWGLRSFASPPDDPQPGDDLYDVYSLAKGEGLNGVHYHDW